MKKYLFALAALSLLFACTGKEEEAPVVKVQSIAIEQGDMTLTEGESVNLSAKVLPENAADKTINWSSSDGSVVMVSSNGKAMALALGKAIITAKSGDKSDFITITVEAKVIPVIGVSLDKTQIAIKVGESETLTPTITPEDATNKKVSWTSSNDNVATVEEGKVVGVQPGSVTITVTTEDGAKTAECPVTVKSNLAPSVTVGADHISAVSVVLQGKANVDNNGTSLILGFQYYKMTGSESPSVTTLISTNADEGNNYTLAIPGLEPSTTYRYWSFVRQNGQDTYGETMEFTTQDIATLLETKETSDVEATSALLNAKLDLTDVQYKTLAYGFLWGTSESALNTDVKCTEIKDNAISAALTGLSHKTQYWYKAYITLDSQTFCGEVKTFTTDVVPVESVSLDKTEYTFNTIGNTLTLKATVLPADATDKSVEWSSDKEDVAAVDANGLVTAQGNGTANITVTTKDQGKSATCVITVAQWVTSISLDKTSLSLEIGDEVTLSVTILPDNANDKSYTWSSSDSAIASVDNSGKVTAKAKGKATIKATANDGSGVNATCSVVVSPKCPAGAVDMGTTTADGYKLYWGTTNLGASKPEDYGDHYAWGETETKENYFWETYKYGTSSSGPFSKYNTISPCGSIDNKTVLEPEDDVANVKLGGKWRMPTDAEWTELRTKCTWTWVTNYNGSGINGSLVKATNGNSIFLPAAGYRNSSDLRGAGSSGCYWSSFLCANYPGLAYVISFSSDHTSSGSDRYLGRSVRPVSEL